MKNMNATKQSSEFHRKLREESLTNADAVSRIKQMYDCFFAFAMIWSFGAALDESKRDFNGYMRSTCRLLTFPEGGTVYDYFFDPVQSKWIHWLDRVKPFDP